MRMKRQDEERGTDPEGRERFRSVTSSRFKKPLISVQCNESSCVVFDFSLSDARDGEARVGRADPSLPCRRVLGRGARRRRYNTLGEYMGGFGVV
jgi:hypothetical protein